MGRDLLRAGIGDDPDWQRLDVPGPSRFPWDAGSTALRPPPFLHRAGIDGDLNLARLAVFGDGMTTDHVSPAEAVPPDGHAARRRA